MKRRPQSRKARIAAARMSSIDTGPETNFQESSRLFVSTSNLVDYQSSPILNDNITDTDSSNEVKKKIQAPFNNKLLPANDNKMYENREKMETKNEFKKQFFLDLFDDNSDPCESIQQKFDRKDSNDNQNIIFGEQLLQSNKSVQEKLPVIESVHEKLPENEPIKEKQPEILSVKVEQPEIKPFKGIQSDIESVNEKLPEIEVAHEKLSEFETQVNVFNVNDLEETKSKSMISNTSLSQKSKSLFDDNDNDNDLFSQKTGNVNKLSSNIFDSDDEFEFTHKFSKKKSDKTKSIFGDDSDDDLFNSPSKPSGSNLTSKKPIG